MQFDRICSLKCEVVVYNSWKWWVNVGGRFMK